MTKQNVSHDKVEGRYQLDLWQKLVSSVIGGFVTALIVTPLDMVTHPQQCVFPHSLTVYLRLKQGSRSDDFNSYYRIMLRIIL